MSFVSLDVLALRAELLLEGLLTLQYKGPMKGGWFASLSNNPPQSILINTKILIILKNNNLN